ncbi:uncharacterized protein LOC108346715 [Vigna angularis]|uniref:uncharacterized protein LOC108346715 n=1 Tax=Phaseolus angularis TaxID=3914 RepID=UPI00080A52AC|nr:uncharacterized protein LOC108346715 [Vigna angularis]
MGAKSRNSAVNVFFEKLKKLPMKVKIFFWVLLAHNLFLEENRKGLSIYLETISVMPQLRLIQNAKMIETFTGYYVFALGVSRFMALPHWIVQICDTRGTFLFLVGSGYFWFLAAFVAEIVQSFILADFCYYYIKSFTQGQLLKKIPI